MENEYYTMGNILFSILPSVFASFLTWFFTRKKYLQEVKSNELDNTKDAISIWKDLALDIRKELDLAKEEIIDLKQRLSKFENEHQ
jgi:hypothetical protein